MHYAGLNRGDHAKETPANILISGGTSGLGKELARCFAERGHRVYVFSRNPDPHTQPDIVTTLKADVTDPESLENLRRTLSGSGVKIDWLVNNAGVTEICSPYDLPYLGRHWRTVLATNVEGPLNTMECFMPDLIASGDGRIINMSSLLGHYPAGFFPVYSGTKAFLSALSKSLSAVNDGSKIRGIDVTLPMLETPMSAGLDLRGVRKMPPLQAARQILQGLDRGKTVINVGDARILMALKRIIPELIQRNFDRMSNEFIGKSKSFNKP